MAIEDVLHRSLSCRPRQESSLIHLRGICVLLVDDDLEQLGLVSELLAEADAEVTTATSADEAVQQLAKDMSLSAEPHMLCMPIIALCTTGCTFSGW